MMSDVVEEAKEDLMAEDRPTVPPGQKLKRARENRNLQQSDIAKELKLDLRFVQALEEGRFKDLPQPVYTAGYVRAYSKLVGLKPDEIVSEYSSQQKAVAKTGSKKKEKEHIPSHYRHVQTDLPKSFSVGGGQSDDKRKFNILVSILAVVVVFAIVWQVSNRSADSTTPATTPATTAVPGDNNAKQPATGAPENPATTEGEPLKNMDATGTTEQQTIDLPLPKPEPQSTAPDLKQSSTQGAVNAASEEARIASELAENAKKLTEVSIYYSQNSWIDIRDATGKPIIRKLGLAGRSNTVSGVAPFEVLLGYSPGVSIELDGKPYDMSPHNDKRVARFVMDDMPTGPGNTANKGKKSKKADRESERFLPDEF